MNVLLITVRSDFGGGPRHVNQLCESLPKDINLYMAYPKDGKPYAEKWCTNNRVKGTLFIPHRRFSLKVLLQMWRFVLHNKIDIVHSHGNGAGVYSRLLKLMNMRIKVVHTFHGITDNYSSQTKRRMNRILGWSLKWMTDRFILVSHGEYELGKKLHLLIDSKATVIYNGIDIPNLQSDETEQDIINVVTLSRFDYQKNMDMALEIVKRLKGCKEIKFVWVGNGDDWERLKKQAENEELNIVFVGFSNNPIKYLQSADIYMSTSRFEGLPYALIEASSLGLPIIATDVTGNNECVVNGNTGFLYNTVDEAVYFINYLYKNREEKIKMSEASRNFFYENFTLEKMMYSIVGVYNEMIKK